MQAKEDVELYFSDEDQEESFNLELLLGHNIDLEIQTHVLLFRSNNVLGLQELLETKLTQKKWCQLCDAVLSFVNLETFLLLPQFLQTPLNFIRFNETCSMPVMDYLFSRFFVKSSPKTIIPIVKYLYENKLISDRVIHDSLVSIVKNTQSVTFSLFFFLFETGKIAYELIHEENYTKTLTTNICLSFLDSCFKGCLTHLKLLELMPKILPEKLIENILITMKSDSKIMTGFRLAKERHATYPKAYEGFRKFWLKTKKEGPQKYWLASQLFFETPARDCIPAIQNNLLNSWEEDMLVEFKYQPK